MKRHLEVRKTVETVLTGPAALETTKLHKSHIDHQERTLGSEKKEQY